MRLRSTILAIAAMLALSATGAWAQALAKVAGTATGLDGKPIVGATVQFQSADTGQKYVLTTDNKGRYFSVGINPGKYKVSLIQDGKVLFFFNNMTVALTEDDSPRQIDFDLPKE